MLKAQFKEEEITVLVGVQQTIGVLGETVEVWQQGATHKGLVTPLGAEQAQKLGLTTVKDQLRVRLPAGVVVQVGDRLRLRGRDWQTVQVTGYSSYTRLIVVFQAP